MYYSAYVYFEKLRLHQGKKRSAKREQMEEAWQKEGGVPREGSHNMGSLLPVGDSWSLNGLGQIEVQRQPRDPRGRGIVSKKARSR